MAAYSVLDLCEVYMSSLPHALFIINTISIVKQNVNQLRETETTKQKE